MKTFKALLFALGLLAFIPSCKKACYYCNIPSQYQYYCMANGAIQNSYPTNSPANVAACQQLYGGTLVANTTANGDTTPYCFSTNGLGSRSDKQLRDQEQAGCIQAGGTWVAQ